MRIRSRLVEKTAEVWQPGKKVDGVCTKYCNLIGGLYNAPHVHTLGGLIRVWAGDYIVTGFNGEKYPVKPDIFKKTYEIIDE